MPSALLRARPVSVILASALPLYALSACELFLGDVSDPPGKAIGPENSADSGFGSGGVSSSTGGESAAGADSASPAAGGTAGTSGGAGAGGPRGGAGGLGSGGAVNGGAPGTGGVVVTGGAPSTGGTGAGGVVVTGGAPGSGGVGTGGVGTGGAGTGGASGSGGAGGCCDCDGDTVRAMGTCGGTDCDDDDVNVFPGQPAYFATASKHRGFDYNCVNGAERDPSSVATVDCSKLLGLGCETGTGYFSTTKVVPACGVSGSWGVCAKPALSCVENKIEDRIMRCH